MVKKRRKLDKELRMGNISVRYSDSILNHIYKHNVRIREVGEVIKNRPLIKRIGGKNWMVIGQTDSGRYLTIYLFQIGRKVFRLKTARDSTDSEKRFYRKHRR